MAFEMNPSVTAKKTLLVYTIFIVSVIALAYLGSIPTKLHAIPFYDSAGHFILYGC